MTTHIVQQGECLARIAHHYGFPDYHAIYDHPANAEFKRRRPNPNLIYPGDELQIPDLRQRQAPCTTDKLHEFKLKRRKRKLRIVVRDWEDEPLANEPYELIVEKKTLRGRTDGNGLLQQEIPMDAEQASITISGHTWPIRIAHLNPMEDAEDEGVSGVQARLKNLGYDPGPVDGILGPRTRAAVRSFQEDYGLTVDGICGPQTRSKLKEIYGC
jgi:hypothetical protein